MKKLIEITELKVGDVIVLEHQLNYYSNGIITPLWKTDPLLLTVQGIAGNIVFVNNGYNVEFYHIDRLKADWKKQVEQERWRAEEGEGYEYIGVDGVITIVSDIRLHADNYRYELGNYFKPGEAQKHVEAFKEFFNKIKQDG